MQLFFSRLRPGELAPLVLAAVALAAQFLWPRLALLALAAIVVYTDAARRFHELAWVLVVLLAFVLVPRDDTGPTLWLLAVDALAITLEVAARDTGARSALVLAVLCARPGADTAVTRAMKVYAALTLGVLLRGEEHAAPMRVALVLLLGPLYALYGVFQCCLLVSAQVEVIHS